MGTTSSSKKYSVFEFNEEEERIEKASRNMLGKYTGTPVTKYNFLHCFARGTKAQQKDNNNKPLDVDAIDDAVTAPSDFSNDKPVNHSCFNHIGSGSSFPRANSYSAKVLNLGVTSTVNQHNDLWGINLDDDSNELSSSSTSASDFADSEGGAQGEQVREHGLSGCDIFSVDESFEDVIYPKGDPDAVSISKRDVQLLQPERFINDTIIDFYMIYLKNKIRPEEKHRFHFFNSFFFRKLEDLDKDTSKACEGRTAFQRVQKWTRKVNLFEKDYIFIPVNFSLHWSLIIICHPGEVLYHEDEEMENSPKVPCILHLDSLKGSHRGLRNLFQSYLLEEWKERNNKPVEDVTSKFLNLHFVPLELPQQENSFDCGIFLLHYVELFLEHAPVNFSPFRISKLSNFLCKDWFPPAEASLKRTHIKKLIFKIAEGNSHEVRSSACEDKEDKYSTISCHGSCSDSNAGQDIESTPMAAVPLRGVQYFGVSELNFGGFLDPEDNIRSLSDDNCQTSVRIVSLPPIEDGEGTAEKIACPHTHEICGHQVAKMTEPPTTSHSAKNFRATDVSVNCEEEEKRDKSSGTPIVGSPVLLDVRKNENDNIYECSSTSSDGLLTCVVEDSEEETVPTFVVEDSEEENKLIEYENEGRIVASSTPSVENIDLTANDLPSVSVLEEWEGAKRLRLMPPDARKELTRKLEKDLILI